MSDRSLTSQRNRELLFRVVVVLVLTGILMLMMTPIYLIAINSFKTTQDYVATGPFRLPQEPTLRVIRSMWVRTEFPTRLLNSTIITISTTALVVLISSCNAFGLAVGRPKRLELILILFMFVMVLPAGALVYPRFYLFRFLGMYNRRLTVILLLTTTHVAFGTFFLTNVLRQFPRDFIEAARVDGLSKLGQLFKIVLPLNGPAVAVLFVFVFIWSWNEFYTALIFLSSSSKSTVPLAILLSKVPMAEPQITNVSAISLLTMLPCVLFFVLFRSYLRNGLTFAGIKG